MIGSSAKKYWYHTDHLGSVKAVTKTDGTLAWKADYLPFRQQFGKSKIAPTFEEDDLGFTGKGFDADIGLYYFNARWYDADTGRFMSEDPMADPNNPNLYSYVANNPLRYTDPTGLGADNPSDPGTMVGPTRPENATDYGPGSGGNSGRSGGPTSGPSSSGGNNNKNSNNHDNNTNDNSSISDGSNTLTPLNLSNLLEQMKKDNPGATIEIKDNKITITSASGVNDVISISALGITVNGDSVSIEGFTGVDENGEKIINFKIMVTDSLSVFSVTPSKETAYKNTKETEVSVGEAESQKSESFLYLDITIKSNGEVLANGTISYKNASGYIFQTKAVINGALDGPEQYQNKQSIKASGILKNYYWNTTVSGEKAEAALNISMMKEGAWSGADQTYIKVNLSKYIK